MAAEPLCKIGTEDGFDPATPLAKLMTLVSDIKHRKENTMPLSLEQFDERVARANKSMDRLETMVDSSGERQAVEEMRREISALLPSSAVTSNCSRYRQPCIRPGRRNTTGCSSWQRP